MAKQSPEQLAAFKTLCRENGLDPRVDVWQHKQSGQWIIGRTGIEKIQGHNNIGIDLELCAAAADFAVVKSTATRTVKPEGKAAKKLSIQSFGSANSKNSQVSYYAEMAEKRAKSRSILMLMGFYSLGVYGEDEADDFKRTAESASLPADVQQDALQAQFSAEGKSNGAATEAPKKPAAAASAPASAPLAASTTAAPSTAANPELEAVLKQIIQDLRSQHITPRERSKMMLGLNKLTLGKAQNCLAKIGETCEYRLTPEALAQARTDLRSFANANASALGQQEYNRLHARAGALTVVAADLIAERQEAEESLKTPQQAAA
jgi:hypothetical protein